MSFFENALETGLFLVPFAGEMPIPVIIWCVVLSAAGIQLLLCRSHRRWLRYGMLCFNAAGFIVCVIACEMITGWDMLAWLIFGGIFFALLIGCAIGFGVHKFMNRKKT